MRVYNVGEVFDFIIVYCFKTKYFREIERYLLRVL